MYDHYHIHLISDSTGETVNGVARAALAQFNNIDYTEHNHSLVRSLTQLERVYEIITQQPGPVIYTLVKKEMRNAIRDYCEQRQLPCISVLGNAITQLSAYFGMATAAEPGRQHGLDKDYFTRVEAINFALAHDDGQNSWNLDAADIILVGPSRTSKSPTCVYLANRGYRAANVPFVYECALPDILFQLTTPLIVGLIIDTIRLSEIRASRLETLGEHRQTDYADEQSIEDEILQAKRLFASHRWPVIDVTRRSVEETAAQIAQIYRRNRKGNRGSE